MIGYLEGELLKIDTDGILLLVNHIGYDVLLPAIVLEEISQLSRGDQISLYIYFHQTERQPKPVLIGFQTELEKLFFQSFLAVEAIGPMKAVKAMTIPVQDIARAIESKDIKALSSLKGIGNRTAQKIVATLHGKMSEFNLPSAREPENQQQSVSADIPAFQQVVDVLISQFGYAKPEAKKLVDEAIVRSPDISSPEALFDEVFRSPVK